eukprot:scaffold165487_cov70-Cyclotella_meneghiniana.AAC.5
MGRWFGSEHTECPNCGRPDEDAAHLMHCTDSGRYGFFRREVNELVEWLQQSHTDPTLAVILPTYILSRGATNMFTMDLPSDYHRFAFTQDQIGWDNFMLGKYPIICGLYNTHICWYPLRS